MDLRGVWKSGVFGVKLRGFWCGAEGCVELRGFLVLDRGVFVAGVRGFWCGTEGFSGLKRSDPFVWNCCVKLGGGCGTEGNPTHLRIF